MIKPLLTAALIAGLAAGCGGDADECQVNGDCTNGATCSADHACIAEDAEPIPDGGADSSATCTPNHDGAIDRDEVEIIVPATVNFETSTQTAVDLVGTTDADGRHWDFSGAMSGDHDAALTTAPLAGQWFASQFPTGQFFSPLAGPDADGLVGVHAVSADKLTFVGAASTAMGFQQTELTYSPALDELVFPLHEGQTWQTTSTVTGTAQGIFTTFTDASSALVDAHGTLTTPYGTFPVLRVRIVLTRTLGFLITKTTTYLFVSECFGTVASVISQSNETATEFTTAVEVKRIAP